MSIIVLMQRQRLGPYFTTRQAVRAGVPAARLRSKEWDAPFSGVRADPAAVDDLSGWGEREREHLHRAKALAPRQDPDAFNTHVTAAVAWQIPLPAGALDDAKIDLGTFAPARLPRIVGVNGHEVRVGLASVVTEPRTGLRVTSPPSTWAMLAAVLRHPYDVVAAGDAIVRTWRVEEPLATIAQLDSAARAGRRVGVTKLRAALPRVRTRSASRPEVWMRLTLVDAGMPEPALNHDIFVAGERVACVDGAYPTLKIALEYEGEHHLKDSRQWAHDIRRYEALEAAGWIVIRITKTELFGAPGEFVARVRRAMARRS
jgi:hypothetical protein